MSDRYLIWSHEHRMWWGPGGCGYTGDPDRAGRYNRGEALHVCAKAAPGTAIQLGALPELPVNEADLGAMRDLFECAFPGQGKAHFLPSESGQGPDGRQGMSGMEENQADAKPNVVDLAERRTPVSYTVHLTQHWNDRLEIWVEGAGSDERSRTSIADALRRAAGVFDPSSGAVPQEVKW